MASLSSASLSDSLIRLWDEIETLAGNNNNDDNDEEVAVSIPQEYQDTVDPMHWMDISQDHASIAGRGWIAKRDIPAGTLLLCEKPLAMLLDSQVPYDDDDEEDEENESAFLSKQNEMLLLKLLEKIKQDTSIWTLQVSQLFPRTRDDLDSLQAHHNHQQQEQQQDEEKEKEEEENNENEDEVAAAAATAWMYSNDATFFRVDAMLQCITPPSIRDEISRRLPYIIHYNVLSVETSPELLVYPSPAGLGSLAGCALYHYASFFNHDAHPVASRYAMGDILCVVANRDITAGQAVCISYLEHDVLCESSKRRTLLLSHYDFGEPMDPNEQQQQNYDDDDGPEAPVIDADVQNELMQMEPRERLAAIDNLMAQARGEAIPEDDDDYNEEEEGEYNEDYQYQQQEQELQDQDVLVEQQNIIKEEEEGNDGEAGEAAPTTTPFVPWFQVDIHNLRILKALTLEGLGQSIRALPVWKECLQFGNDVLPPLDEAKIVLLVQTALCCWTAALEPKTTSTNDNDAAVAVVEKEEEKTLEQQARIYAKQAVEMHHSMFGGGIAFFRRRYQQEFRLALRPEEYHDSGINTLWPHRE